ncbi:MAG: GNAT family N-acetyltransferase [Butyrivibrio sp.]|nr:GNAT family N-acetyltransferase [Butyrivibrio sp.]
MKLAWDTFVRYNAPDYSQEGIENFKKFVNDDMLRKMFLAGHYQLFVAVFEGKYLGMLSLREKKHISLLFVDGDCHGNGIGKALIRFVSKYVLEEEGIDKMTVNASPYALEFYHKMGFKDLREEMEADGIIFTPMELSLVKKS